MNEEILAEIRCEIENLKAKVAVLEQRLSDIENAEKATEVEEAGDMEISVEDIIDLEEYSEEPVKESVVEDLPLETIAEPEPEPVKEPEPEPIKEPEPEPVEERAFTDLFGGPAEVDNSVNARHSAKVAKTLSDAYGRSEAWRTDMPGSPVKNVLSAISLNDRLLFIRSLYSDNAGAFSQDVQMINAGTSFEGVVDKLKAAHPDWNYDGEAVYRLMMAIRRKLS